MGDLAGVPAELATRERFVCFRFGWKRAKDGRLKLDKVPTHADTGQPLKWRAPDVWMALAEASAAAERGRLSGVGIVLVAADGLVGIDLDHCVDPATGAVESWAQAIVDRFASYTEITPSGTGLRIFVYGRLPPGRRRVDLDAERHLEAYDHARFLTVTGKRLPGTPATVEQRAPELAAWHAEAFPAVAVAPPAPVRPAAAVVIEDDAIIRLAGEAKNGALFARLWAGQNGDYADNESRGDAALLGILAFYTQDPVQLERLMRKSQRRRPKWDSRRGQTTWLRQDIANALRDLNGNWYTPPLQVELDDAGARGNGVATATGTPPPVSRGTGGGDDGDDDEGGDEPPSLAPGVDGFALTDLGNAERLLAAHGRHLRYCATWGKWLAWDGTRWVVDADETHARAFARRVIRKMSRDAQRRIPDDKKGALRLFKWAVKCETASRAPAMLAHARTFARVWVTPDQLDADDYLLNCANGTIDLRTGGLRRHDPADLLTQLAPVVYDPGAACPVWERSLEEIFCEDAELGAFVQRLVGVSITGDVKDHLFPVAWGSTGRNGKGLLLETLVTALGDYGATLPADELMATRNERHPTGLATLYRKRLVVASETEGGRRLAVARVKELSGGNPITARRMREDFWTFRATHTVWLVTNDKPEIRETKDAIWDRVKLLPFRVYFRDPARPDERPHGAPERILDKDPDRYRKVARELPGILAWAVRGCLAWQREGLREPQVVVAATDTYRDEQDVLARFLEDRCELGAQLKAEATPLYLAYRGWCERVGERPESQTRFGERLSERGHGALKDPVTRLMVRLGLRLVPLPDEAAPPPAEAPA